MRIRTAGWLVMAAMLAWAPWSGAQERPVPPKGREPARVARDVRRGAMGLKQRQAKARFQNQRCELELEKQRLALEKARRDLDRPAVPAHPGRAAWGECPAAGKPFRGILLICAIVHVLLAVWVFSDIRHRNAGSGLWIVIALLSGLFGALVYAVARLGDKPAQT